MYSKLLITVLAFMLIQTQVFAEEITADQLTTTDTETSPKKETAGEKILDQTKKIFSETSETVKKSLEENKKLRESFNYFALLSYSPMDLVIPGKIGASIGYNSSPDYTWEFEYLHGSVAVPFLIKDLGKMSDDRISLIRRSYLGTETFNLSYGVSYFDFSVHLGDKFLNQLTGGSYPSLDIITIKSLGFNIGAGNRWNFKNRFILSIDWISWSQPLIMVQRNIPYLDYATNQSDKDDVDNASKLIAYLPRITLLKLQIGYLF